MARRLLSVVVLLVLVGCESVGTQLLRNENAHAFYQAQLAKSGNVCGVTPPPAQCVQQVALLNEWKLDVLQAAWIDWPPEDVKAGPKHPRIGPIPLQLKQLKADAAAAKNLAAEIAKGGK